jgi:hypothetical protein
MSKKSVDYREHVGQLLARSRREFLQEFGSLTVAGATASAAGLPIAAARLHADDLSLLDDFGGLTGRERAEKAYNARVTAAVLQKAIPLPKHDTNGDESRYANRIGNYSKGLPHNNAGEVDRNAYETLLTALRTAKVDDFERITMGGSVKLTNPQAGLGFDMEGPDPAALYQPPAPAFASAEEAGEMAEVYWHAVTRDVNFLDYDTHPLTHAAAADLSRMSDFRGPKIARSMPLRGSVAALTVSDEAAAENRLAEIEETQQTIQKPLRAKAQSGVVTTQTLFRGTTPGDLTGPYISQFLWKDAPFGAQTISGRMRTVNPGVDYLTRFSDWLVTQNGNGTFNYTNDPTPRYIRNGRDLGEWVHIDVLFQAYFNAMLLLLGSGVPFDQNNPYNRSRTQIGFGSFGPPHIAALVCEVATRALKAVWFQKWYVHRRLRPEVFGGRIHQHLNRAANYPIHGDILNSTALNEVFRRNGTYLLPMAFPEGSPTHPAYGAGHATVAGACVTILKAWFDESYVMQDLVVPAADGLTLQPYRGSANLTVGGELNKLASNVAFGRNIAGVHWRSDATESLKLGEAVALGVLEDFTHCYNENFDGFTLTKFNGTRVTVG